MIIRICCDMIAVSNTTAIIYLAEIDHLHILRGLFGDVLVPEQVYREIKEPTKNKVVSCNWIKKVKIHSAKTYEYLTNIVHLHPGEAAAITCALEKDANYLIMDETHARIEANIIIKQNNLSLKIMSLPTMLKIAYKRKIIQNYLDTLTNYIELDICHLV